MGLLKFLINLSPGSPKATAKKFIERYKYFSDIENSEEVFEDIYDERILTNAAFGLSKHGSFMSVDPDKLIMFCKGDLPTLIFCTMAIESNKLFHQFYTNKEMIETAVEIIFETVNDNMPSLVTKNIGILFKDCQCFIFASSEFKFDKN